MPAPITPDDLLSTAAAVATRLGRGWRADAPPHGGRALHLRHSDGADLLLFSDQARAGRLVIEGADEPSPEVTVHDLDFGRIGVSLDRGPAVIAAEIERRLLPVYVAAVATLRVRQTRARDCAARRQAGQQRLAAALGVPCPADSREPIFRQLPAGPTASCGITVYSDGTGATADISVHDLPLDRAEAVAALLAQAPSEA